MNTNTKHRRSCRTPTRVCLELLEPRVLLHGLTVVTHGFQLSTGTPNWVTSMGADIAARMGPDTSVYKLTLSRNGSQPLVSGLSQVQGPSLFTGTTSNAETVLLIDWSADSGIGFPTPYFSTTQLAALIVPWLTNPLTSNGITVSPLAQGAIQLIGHSRGASLMSALAADLGQAGIWVDQLTPLDPHPISSDAVVTVASNVVFADNYYETADATPGSAIAGAYNMNLTSVNPSHSGIHAWYDGTIDLAATNDGDGITISPSWYVSNPRNATGFFYSRTVGGTRPSVGVGTLFGGSGSRVAVVTSGTQWPNVGMLAASTTSLMQGQAFSVSYDYQYAPSTSSVQFFLDRNQNPYDGNGIALGSAAVLSATGATVQQNLASLTAAAPPGVYYLEAAITNGSQTRIAYATAPITVAAAFVYYRGSVFDSANHSTALAPDKTPLLPGQIPTFANYTSYSRGINGLMIDLPAPAGTLTTANFTFKVGGDSPGNVDPTIWAAASDPTSITLHPGGGLAGTTRVEISWPENIIQNQWLQVTLKASAATGLAADATFYFGNAIGDSGNDPTNARVTAIDEIATRASAAPDAAITNPYDFNRDGVVDADDEFIARTHVTYFLNELQWLAAPAPAAAQNPLVAAIPQPLTHAFPMPSQSLLLHYPRLHRRRS